MPPFDIRMELAVFVRWKHPTNNCFSAVKRPNIIRAYEMVWDHVI